MNINEIKTKNVKISTFEGSGFCYIGTSDNLSLLEKEDEWQLKRYIHFWKNAKNREKKAIERLNCCDDLFEMNELIKTINAAKETKRALASRIINYVPLKERAVVKTYASISEPDTTIIVLTGYAIGTGWFSGDKLYERHLKQLR